MSDRTANLKPWPKGVSGNPGGRPKTKPITEELERLLAEARPNGNGQTRATGIAEALIQQASKGDVRAIAELMTRIEGRPLQAVNVNTDGLEGLAEQLAAARKRVLDGMTSEEIEQKIEELKQQLFTVKRTSPGEENA